MIPVGITQRSLPPTEFGERRYGLDSRWSRFLACCDLAAVPLPNIPAVALRMADALGLRGLIFSGGEDLGSAPDRDTTEHALLTWATGTGRPILGVCRGAQFLLHAFGATLEPVAGHVATRHRLSDGRTVNSYHHYAATAVPAPLRITARCDAVVEAFEHEQAPLAGIMWHPEREDEADAEDVRLVLRLFGSVRCGR